MRFHGDNRQLTLQHVYVLSGLLLPIIVKAANPDEA
jgi:hypothetical protein